MVDSTTSYYDIHFKKWSIDLVLGQLTQNPELSRFMSGMFLKSLNFY